MFSTKSKRPRIKIGQKRTDPDNFDTFDGIIKSNLLYSANRDLKILAGNLLGELVKFDVEEQILKLSLDFIEVSVSINLNGVREPEKRPERPKSSNQTVEPIEVTDTYAASPESKKANINLQDFVEQNDQPNTELELPNLTIPIEDHTTPIVKEEKPCNSKLFLEDNSEDEGNSKTETKSAATGEADFSELFKLIQPLTGEVNIPESSQEKETKAVDTDVNMSLAIENEPVVNGPVANGNTMPDLNQTDPLPAPTFAWKMYTCHLCGYTSKSKSLTAKNKHKCLKINNKYQCEYCDYSTNDAGNFKRHRLRIHSTKHMEIQGEKRFKCEEEGCDFATNYDGRMVQHRRTKHGHGAIIGSGMFSKDSEPISLEQREAALEQGLPPTESLGEVTDSIQGLYGLF